MLDDSECMKVERAENSGAYVLMEHMYVPHKDIK